MYICGPFLIPLHILYWSAFETDGVLAASLCRGFCGVILVWLWSRLWQKVKHGSAASGRKKLEPKQNSSVGLTRLTTAKPLGKVLSSEFWSFFFFGNSFFSFSFFFGWRSSTCCLFLISVCFSVQLFYRMPFSCFQICLPQSS